MDNKEIIIGVIAVVVIVAAAYVYLGAQNATHSGVSDAQLNAAVSQADDAVAQMDNVTDELSAINSQDLNASVTDAIG